MKITAIIISLLVIETTASFFDEFRDAFESVEFSVEKMFSDVLTGVTDTIDCTLMEVEKVLSLGIKDTSEYERKCKGQIEQYRLQNNVQDTSYTPPSQPQIYVTNETPHEISKAKEEVTKEITHQIDASLSNVNQTINKLMNNVQKKIENVKSVLKNETERLVVGSTLDNKALHEILTDTKRELGKIQFDHKPSIVDDVLGKVKSMYDIEHSSLDAHITPQDNVEETVKHVEEPKTRDSVAENILNNVKSAFEVKQNDTKTSADVNEVHDNNETKDVKDVENNRLPSVENILNEVKSPDKVEQTDKNTFDVNGILHTDHINSIMKDIGHTSAYAMTDDIQSKFSHHKVEKEPVSNLESVVDTKSKIGKEQPVGSADFPLNFQAVAKRIFEDKYSEPKEKIIDITDSPAAAESRSGEDLPLLQMTETTSPVEEASVDETSKFHSLLNSIFAPKNPEPPKEDAKEANKLVEPSKFSSTIGNKAINENKPSESSTNRKDTSVSPVTETPTEEGTSDYDYDIADYDSLFSSFFASNDLHSKEVALKDAENLIEQSKYSSMIMDSLAPKNNDASTDWL